MFGGAFVFVLDRDVAIDGFEVVESADDEEVLHRRKGGEEDKGCLVTKGDALRY